MRGFDCATVINQYTANLFAKDHSHVGRYLVPRGWKRLTLPEVQIITNAGIKIISVFETYADRPKGGTLAGVADGQSALQCALDVKQTLGTAIYFAVDYDASPSDMPVIRDYLKAAKSQIKGYSIGVYGSYDVMEAVKDICEHFWQCAAWSKGRRFLDMNLFQYDIDKTVNGIQVDLNEIYDNVGGWNADMIPVDEANKLIATIKAQYAVAKDQATKDELHRQADYLRVLSGQPVT